MMDRHNYASSTVEPAALEWFLNIVCCLWTSVFIVLVVSEPGKVNWLVTVGKRFNWQVIMGCDRSNKEAWSRSRPRADRTRWLMSDRFSNCIQQHCVDMLCVWNYAGLFPASFPAEWNNALIIVGLNTDLVNLIKKRYIKNTHIVFSK